MSAPPERARAAATSRELELVTFNVGLAPTVPNRAERAPRVTEKVAQSNADVLCLQEVWSEADATRITSSLKSKHRHVVRGPRQSAERATRCTSRETSLMRQCVARSCAPSSDPVACVLSHCRGVAAQLSAGCVSCLAQDPDLAPAHALSSCEAGRSSTDFVYAGNTGLILALAKLPVRTDTFLLPSENVARGVIHAQLEDPPMDVYCTHFTARGELSTRAEWERISARQVEVLLGEITTRSGARPVAVLGDLNFGADAAAFAELEQSRFESPYAKRDGRCTLCGGGPRFVIDHVLTRDPLRVHRVDRVWDQDELSDHHGVQVAVSLPIRS